MNKLYGNYINDISTFMKEGKRGNIKKAMSNFDGNRIDESKLPWIDINRGEVNFNSLKNLSSITNYKSKYHLKLGAHPDFDYLKNSNRIEYHYITTMFIDIKKSLNLFKYYYPDTVAKINKTIQDAAIHTCWYFNGYVHRLQGDGLMVYFGGKNIDIKQSTSDALNAAAFFTYFIKNDLKDVFNELGINSIYTRIGIDTGEKDDVLWHLAGMGECSEITTCSLHTSLASKLQAQAKSNGVMVGYNLVKHKKIEDVFFKEEDYIDEGEKTKYIFTIPDENFYYTQHEFSWESYLRKHPLVKIDDNGNLLFNGDSILPNNSLSEKNINYLENNVQSIKPYFK